MVPYHQVVHKRVVIHQASMHSSEFRIIVSTSRRISLQQQKIPMIANNQPSYQASIIIGTSILDASKHWSTDILLKCNYQEGNCEDRFDDDDDDELCLLVTVYLHVIFIDRSDHHKVQMPRGLSLIDRWKK